MNQDDIKLWNKIKEGEMMHLEVYDGSNDMCEFWDEEGKKIYGRHHKFINLEVSTIRDMFYEPIIWGKKIYLQPNPWGEPFHDDTRIVYNPDNFQPSERVCRHLRVALHQIPNGIGYNQHSFEILDIKPNRRRLLLTRKI